jgi:alpha-glucosidase
MSANWLSSIHHDGSDRYVSNLYPRLGQTVRLRLRVSHQASVHRVVLRTLPNGEQRLTPYAARGDGTAGPVVGERVAHR